MASGLRYYQVVSTVSPLINRDRRLLIRLLIWTLLAAIAVIAFAGAFNTQRRRARERSSFSLAGNPQEGSLVFRAKGCIRCHSVNGEGGKVGPDLGLMKSGQSTLPQLVTAMWNHAPQMWARMQADGIRYPALSYDEVADLLAYLYLSRHMDGPGDPARGSDLFSARGCMHCHAIRGLGGKIGPDLATAGDLSGPMDWTGALWNHASGMRRATEHERIAWPQFQDHELRDLYAYARQNAVTGSASLGDPERGWRIFQQKSCIGCHSIRTAYQLTGPSLGPQRELPQTFTQLAGMMISHFPQMDHAMEQQGIQRPELSSQEMTDIFAFLYSLRYVEPGGSPQVGASVFQWRGCSRCHGINAQGTRRAPALRVRTYNSVALAVALWRHGQRMYTETRQVGIGWPTLGEDDIGDLLAFLNLPAEATH